MVQLPSFEQFEQWCHNFDKFSVDGEVVEVDTTEFTTADFEEYIEMAKRFIME